MTAEKSIEQRLVALETHVAQLEHLTDQLNEVVVNQSNELKRLQQQLQKLTGTIENEELERIRSTNAKPPHYQ